MADLLEEQTEPRSPPGAFGPKLLSAFSTSPSASPPSSFKRRTSWGEHQSGPPSRNSSRRSSRVQLDPHFTARRLGQSAPLAVPQLLCLLKSSELCVYRL